MFFKVEETILRVKMIKVFRISSEKDLSNFLNPNIIKIIHIEVRIYLGLGLKKETLHKILIISYVTCLFLPVSRFMTQPEFANYAKLINHTRKEISTGQKFVANKSDEEFPLSSNLKNNKSNFHRFTWTKGQLGYQGEGIAYYFANTKTNIVLDKNAIIYPKCKNEVVENQVV